MDITLISKQLKSFSKRVGRSMARTPLLLYYVLQSNETSKKDKAIIAVCLGYLILPVDLIPSSRFSIFGWIDEILSVEIVFDRMRRYITPEMYSRADAQLDNWFNSTNNSYSGTGKQKSKSTGTNLSSLSEEEQKSINSVISKW